MPFRIIGLEPAPFRRLYGLPDEAPRAEGVRCHADAVAFYPDGIGFRDAAIGSQCFFSTTPTSQPTRRSGPAKPSTSATAPTAPPVPVAKPAALRVRLISLRALDAFTMMVGADAVDGMALDQTIGMLNQRKSLIVSALCKSGVICGAGLEPVSTTFFFEKEEKLATPLSRA